MKQTIHFTKMHGAGNDYIYVNTSLYPVSNPSKAAVILSDRHKGIGSDGLVLIGTSESMQADFNMRIFNADGSEGAMCGNAARCIGKYLFEKGICRKETIRLRTKSGVRVITVKPCKDDPYKAEKITVDMQRPKFEHKAQFDSQCGNTLCTAGKPFKGTFVSMGNPHFVVFTDKIDKIDICEYGPLLERHPAFPQGCNIEFVQKLSDDSLRVRVWERGSGLTQACGTGACAAAAAAIQNGICESKVKVAMDGGTLKVKWNSPKGHIFLSGPAEFVFEGDIELE